IADLKKIRKAGQTLLGLFNDSQFLKPLSASARRASSMIRSSLRESFPTSLPAFTEAPVAGTEMLAGLILVVDDNEMNRHMLVRRPQRQEHTVMEAENGRKALESLESVRVDLVLLDILMPELDGMQTLEMLKAHKTNRHTPVVMLSALDELDKVV